MRKKLGIGNREIPQHKEMSMKLISRDMAVNRIITSLILTVITSLDSLEVHQEKKEELLQQRRSPLLRTLTT